MEVSWNPSPRCVSFRPLSQFRNQALKPVLYLNGMREINEQGEKYRGGFQPWPMWLSWLELCPVTKKLSGSIPGWDASRRQPIDVPLSARCFSLSHILGGLTIREKKFLNLGYTSFSWKY